MCERFWTLPVTLGGLRFEGSFVQTALALGLLATLVKSYLLLRDFLELRNNPWLKAGTWIIALLLLFRLFLGFFS